ncbi:MAG TPA: tetratricopeptide repeat protein [Thermoanaerobaculia bacterium]|nr:tetratricopeptide repeat protein [Thermoanaerobaculia bacterium]
MRGRIALFLVLLVAAAARAQDTSKLETEAKRAFDSGLFADAGDKYSRAAQTAGVAPDRQADLFLQAAWSFYIGGNARSARESLKSAFRAKPTLAVAGDLYSPDFARLAQTVRGEVTGSSDVVDVAEIKRDAREKLQQGKAEDALASLKRGSSSNDPELHRLLGETYDRLGRPSEADVERKRASDIERGLITTTPIGGSAPPAAGVTGPVAASAWLQSAENLVRAGDARGAEAGARRAIEADPRNADAHGLLGDLLLASGKETEAEHEFTTAMSLDASQVRSHYGLAVLSERQGKWNTAASLCRRALDLSPNNVAAALGLGRAMEEVKDPTAARLAYGRAIEIDPSSAEAHNDFGVFLSRSGEVDRAIEELMQAVRLAPQRAVYHENLGRVFRKKGMLKEAERETAEASRLSPNEVAVWTTLGDLRRRLKRPDDAATAYSAAFHIDPTSEEAAAGLAAALSDSGKLPDAEAALQKGIEARPGSAVLWNNLGVLRTRRGAYAEAIAAFQKALSLNAGMGAARANLERAEQLLAIDKAGG